MNQDSIVTLSYYIENVTKKRQKSNKSNQSNRGAILCSNNKNDSFKSTNSHVNNNNNINNSHTTPNTRSPMLQLTQDQIYFQGSPSPQLTSNMAANQTKNGLPDQIDLQTVIAPQLQNTQQSSNSKGNNQPKNKRKVVIMMNQPGDKNLAQASKDDSVVVVSHQDTRQHNPGNQSAVHKVKSRKLANNEKNKQANQIMMAGGVQTMNHHHQQRARQASEMSQKPASQPQRDPTPIRGSQLTANSDLGPKTSRDHHQMLNNINPNNWLGKTQPHMNIGPGNQNQSLSFGGTIKAAPTPPLQVCSEQSINTANQQPQNRSFMIATGTNAVMSFPHHTVHTQAQQAPSTAAALKSPSSSKTIGPNLQNLNSKRKKLTRPANTFPLTDLPMTSSTLADNMNIGCDLKTSSNIKQPIATTLMSQQNVQMTDRYQIVNVQHHQTLSNLMSVQSSTGQMSNYEPQPLNPQLNLTQSKTKELTTATTTIQAVETPKIPYQQANSMERTIASSGNFLVHQQQIINTQKQLARKDLNTNFAMEVQIVSGEESASLVQRVSSFSNLQPNTSRAGNSGCSNLYSQQNTNQGLGQTIQRGTSISSGQQVPHTAASDQATRDRILSTGSKRNCLPALPRTSIQIGNSGPAVSYNLNNENKFAASTAQPTSASSPMPCPPHSATIAAGAAVALHSSRRSNVIQGQNPVPMVISGHNQPKFIKQPAQNCQNIGQNHKLMGGKQSKPHTQESISYGPSPMMNGTDANNQQIKAKAMVSPDDHLSPQNLNNFYRKANLRPPGVHPHTQPPNSSQTTTNDLRKALGSYEETQCANMPFHQQMYQNVHQPRLSNNMNSFTPKTGSLSIVTQVYLEPQVQRTEEPRTGQQNNSNQAPSTSSRHHHNQRRNAALIREKSLKKINSQQAYDLQDNNMQSCESSPENAKKKEQSNPNEFHHLHYLPTSPFSAQNAADGLIGFADYQPYAISPAAAVKLRNQGQKPGRTIKSPKGKNPNHAQFINTEKSPAFDNFSREPNRNFYGDPNFQRKLAQTLTNPSVCQREFTALQADFTVKNVAPRKVKQGGTNQGQASKKSGGSKNFHSPDRREGTAEKGVSRNGPKGNSLNGVKGGGINAQESFSSNAKALTSLPHNQQQSLHQHYSVNSDLKSPQNSTFQYQQKKEIQQNQKRYLQQNNRAQQNLQNTYPESPKNTQKAQLKDSQIETGPKLRLSSSKGTLNVGRSVSIPRSSRQHLQDSQRSPLRNSKPVLSTQNTQNDFAPNNKHILDSPNRSYVNSVSRADSDHSPKQKDNIQTIQQLQQSYQLELQKQSSQPPQNTNNTSPDDLDQPLMDQLNMNFGNLSSAVKEIGTTTPSGFSQAVGTATANATASGSTVAVAARERQDSEFSNTTRADMNPFVQQLYSLRQFTQAGRQAAQNQMKQEEQKAAQEEKPEGDHYEPYEIIQKVGQGNFGTIFWASTKKEDSIAVKVIKKTKIQSLKQASQIVREKRIMEVLTEANNIFAPVLFGTHQDSTQLEFRMEFVRGCELLHVMNRLKPYYTMYAAEVICALEELHRLKIVYRDLKPEHILINMQGHCKIVDFGLSALLTSKQLEDDSTHSNTVPTKDQLGNTSQGKCYTNCGTAEYVAPEVLKAIGTSYEADVWSFGVLLHEIVTGETPFYAEDPQELYDNVIQCRPTYALSLTLAQKVLLDQIFVPDPGFRISLNLIKGHVIFKGIDWRAAKRHEMQMPFIPVEGEPYHNCTRKPNGKGTGKKKPVRAGITSPVKVDKNGMPAVESPAFKNQWLRTKDEKQDVQGQQTVVSKDMDMSYLKNTNVITGSRQKRSPLGNFWKQNVQNVLANF